MTVWTPARVTSPNWTEESTLAEPRVFSPSVFSLVYFNGFRVFAVEASVWNKASSPAPTWVAE